MNYFEVLRKRTLCLQESFSEKESVSVPRPVLPHPVRKKMEKRPVSGAERPRRTGPKAPAGEHLLRGIENAALAAQPQSLRPEAGSGKAAAPRREAPAEALLRRVQRAEYRARSTAQTAQEVREEMPFPAARSAAAPEDWSDWFERDARRYDGAYERM